MSDSSESKASALGITFTGDQGNIAVYSSNATKIELCILDDNDFRQITDVLPLHRGSHDLWSASSSKIRPGIKYVLRADGPTGQRHGFKAETNLIDPYAKAVHRENQREYYCVAIKDDFDWQGVAKPNTPLDETIIYEAHLRGLRAPLFLLL